MKTNAPILTVVIPYYNQGQYLPEILSCFPDYKLQNTYEVIFVNDGSTSDNTHELLSKVEHQGFQVVHQDNQGLCAARNNGISLAKGKYILTLDGDDLISTELIFKAIDILENNAEYSVVYCDGEYFNGEYFNGKTGPWVVGEFNLQRLMVDNYMPSLAVFRKAAWKKAKGYDSRLIGIEDWDLWLSIAFAGGKFYYINKKLFDYRMTHTSISHNITNLGYEELGNYLQEKHNQYLGWELLTNDFILRFRNNKRLWIKLFFRVYFPKYFDKLVKDGRVKTTGLY